MGLTWEELRPGIYWQGEDSEKKFLVAIEFTGVDDEYQIIATMSQYNMSVQTDASSLEKAKLWAEAAVEGLCFIQEKFKEKA